MMIHIFITFIIIIQCRALLEYPSSFSNFDQLIRIVLNDGFVGQQVHCTEGSPANSIDGTPVYQCNDGDEAFSLMTSLGRRSLDVLDPIVELQVVSGRVTRPIPLGDSTFDGFSFALTGPSPLNPGRLIYSPSGDDGNTATLFPMDGMRGRILAARWLTVECNNTLESVSTVAFDWRGTNVSSLVLDQVSVHWCDVGVELRANDPVGRPGAGVSLNFKSLFGGRTGVEGSISRAASASGGGSLRGVRISGVIAGQTGDSISLSADDASRSVGYRWNGIILEDLAVEGARTGLRLVGATDFRCSRCNFTQNGETGALISQSSGAQFVDCTVLRNGWKWKSSAAGQTSQATQITDRWRSSGGLQVFSSDHIVIRGGYFSGNVGSSGSRTGGAVTLGSQRSPATNVVLVGTVFDDNMAPTGGCVRFGGGQNFTVKQCRFNRCRASSAGGGLWIDELSGQLTLVDSVFRGSPSSLDQSSSGAAMYIRGRSPLHLAEFTNLTAAHNTAQLRGGALVLDRLITENGTLTLSDVQLAFNQVDNRYGNRSVRLSGDNVGAGGALYAAGCSHIVLKGFLGRGNSAFGAGGAAHVRGGSLSILESVFEDNVARGGGGALYFTGLNSQLPAHSLSVGPAVVARRNVAWAAGTTSLDSARLELYLRAGDRFYSDAGAMVEAAARRSSANNTLPQFGFFASNVTGGNPAPAPTVTDSRGGAFHIVDCPGEVRVGPDVSLIDNVAASGGGGAYCADVGSLQWNQTLSAHNGAYSRGGGAVRLDRVESARLVGSIFVGNAAGGDGDGGGALSASLSSLFADDCLFVDNAAHSSDGGALFWDVDRLPARTFQLSTVLFVANSAHGSGGAVFADGSSSDFFYGGKMSNCSFHFNVARSEGGSAISSSVPFNSLWSDFYDNQGVNTISFAIGANDGASFDGCSFSHNTSPVVLFEGGTTSVSSPVSVFKSSCVCENFPETGAPILCTDPESRVALVGGTRVSSNFNGSLSGCDATFYVQNTTSCDGSCPRWLPLSFVVNGVGESASAASVPFGSAVESDGFGPTTAYDCNPDQYSVIVCGVNTDPSLLVMHANGGGNGTEPAGSEDQFMDDPSSTGVLPPGLLALIIFVSILLFCAVVAAAFVVRKKATMSGAGGVDNTAPAATEMIAAVNMSPEIGGGRSRSRSKSRSRSRPRSQQRSRSHSKSSVAPRKSDFVAAVSASPPAPPETGTETTAERSSRRKSARRSKRQSKQYGRLPESAFDASSASELPASHATASASSPTAEQQQPPLEQGPALEYASGDILDLQQAEYGGFQELAVKEPPTSYSKDIENENTENTASSESEVITRETDQLEKSSGRVKPLPQVPPNLSRNRGATAPAQKSLPSPPVHTKTAVKYGTTPIKPPTTESGVHLDPRSEENDLADVPAVVRACVTRLLDEAALATPGLFRESADAADVKRLAAIDNDDEVATAIATAEFHSAAAFLKHFFRELKDRNTVLFPEAVRKEIGAADAAAAKDCDDSEVIDHLRHAASLCPSLPLLRCLFRLLRDVCANKQKNQMSAINLSICWTPTLLGSAQFTDAISLFISHCDAIFP